MKYYPSFNFAFNDCVTRLISHGVSVRPNNWQSMDVSKKKEAEMLELLNESFSVVMPTTDLKHYQSDIKPNLPWADNHFELERVSGQPINPGITWKEWPWGLSADKFRKADEKFEHTYAERYWPTFAGDRPMGIRYPYGDLYDVVDRLITDPLTRQAVLSVWHPEDQHNGGQRVPCSLFYHFIQRHGFLHLVYTIRSCDALRHFRDDMYLTARLLLWMLDQLKQKDQYWKEVKPGLFTMHITSLHCFIGDVTLLKSQALGGKS